MNYIYNVDVCYFRDSIHSDDNIQRDKMQRTNINDSNRDVLFSPRGVKPGSAAAAVKHRKDIWTQTIPTTSSSSTETEPEETTHMAVEQKEDTTCAICMEVTSKTKNVSVTECGHRFCTSCLLKSLQTSNRCPMCRAEIEPARKPNLEQLTANVAADLIQAEERDIDIHRRIALIGAFNDPRGRSDMILSLCRELAFGVSHSIAGWQGTDDQTYHSSWVDYEYNNYDDDDDDDEDDETEDGDDEDDSSSDNDNDNEDNDNENDNDNDDHANGDTEKRNEIDPPPSYDEVLEVFPTQVFPTQTQATTTTQTTTTTTPSSSMNAFTINVSNNVISGVVSGVVYYIIYYTVYYTLPNLMSGLVDTVGSS